MQQLSDELNDLYQCDCGHDHSVDLNNLIDNSELEKRLLAAAENIWKDKALPEGLIDRQVTRAFATELWQAVESGYGIKLTDLDFDSPDRKMLTSLQRQTWQFAGAKNYTQLRQIGAELLGGDGRLRSKADFIRAATRINETFSKQYLAAEYQLAVQGGIHAAKWVNIENNSAALPWVEIDPILDGQTTSICRPLEGLVLRWDDPRLDEVYPPNHFGCRTTARNKAFGPRGNTQVPTTDIPPMFQVNLGKRGLAFPPEHPYFIDLPEEVHTNTEREQANGQ